MSRSNSSPDWFARSTALLAIILTVISLYFTYRNYHWQTKIYQDSLEERILVHFGFKHHLENNKGDVGIDVVNIGMHPIYIKSVQIEVPCALMTEAPQTLGGCQQCKLESCAVAIYDRDPTEPHEPIKPLAPSEETTYRKEWDFSKYPLHKLAEETDEASSEKIWVLVETTKKGFRQHPIFSWAAITDTLDRPTNSQKSKR